MLIVGKKAPNFTLPSFAGKNYGLIDFAGKKLVLYFYPKDNTSGCTKEACSFESHRTVFKRKGAIVVGVSADSTESHEKFAKKQGITFPLLSDEKKKISKAYGVWKEKSLYGKKFLGIERTTVVIDEKGVVQHIFRKVKVDGHTEEVLAVL
jgi:thioredoxin-dependent peroxiredoxin